MKNISEGLIKIIINIKKIKLIMKISKKLILIIILITIEINNKI
jgi:hypothetical protein